uniref:Protein FAR1-RELATED SEQUENCE n=1 Tax=Cannabis sativa TaxID=3483 RepID=A0A803QFQ4_CANSA
MDRTFCCSCEGTRGNDKRNVNVKRHRAETRFGCLAKMKINCRQIGKYQVVEFIAEHNHVTSSPIKSHLHRSQRRLSATQVVEIELAESSGITPKASVELMARRAGGHIDDLLTNIFWADAKMKEAYSHFDDVICFDTTYRKNHECRPFAMFVGVNHHKQTTLFGAASLYDETCETFIWLFDTFSAAMLGKMPKTILTDQNAAMAKALASQWPETYHRLCIWHMYQNATKHLSSIFQKFRQFSKDFGDCIHEYEEEDEFIEAWNKMLERYNLKDNDWLGRTFKVREKWALVYGRDIFCANMNTTQRSESMNNVLKHYVSY